MLPTQSNRLFALFLLSISLSPAALAASRSDYIDHALNATDVLNQDWYNSDNGLWQDLWWNSANALTAIADLAAIDTNTYSFDANYYFSTTFEKARAYNGGNWLNDFYDDEGWWALAWIRAWDITNSDHYLKAAQNIFEDLINGRGATCTGHWWDKPHTANTAIGNSLYLYVGAALANRVDGKREYYKKHATHQADWFLKSGLINSENTVTDGLDLDSCKPTGTHWTYNSGSVIGAFVEMHKLTGDDEYLHKACDIAYGVMNYLSNGGILTEPSSPNLDDTSAQFKGVFVRNLAYLYSVKREDAFVSFLQHNADSLWLHGRHDPGQLGSQWQGPYDTSSMATQTSALACLIAAASVS